MKTTPPPTNPCSHRATVLAALSLAVLSAAASHAQQIQITTSSLHQQIYGFGATAGVPTNTLYTNQANGLTVCDFLFKPSTPTTPGLGLSLVRLQINPYQTGLQQTIEPTQATWDYNTDAFQKWFAQQAIARGVSRFYALPWSPPWWMKIPMQSGGEIGGTINTAHYHDMAIYLEHYIVHYSNADWPSSGFNPPGIPITWIALQNEPNIYDANYACCGYNDGTGNDYPGNGVANADYGDMATKVVNFLETDIGTSLPNTPLPVQVLGPEASNTGASINYLTHLSAAALANLNITSTHNYDTAPNGFQDGLFNASYPSRLWQTEHCLGKTTEPTPGSTADTVDALYWADEMWTWLEGDASGSASAYFFFWAVNDTPNPTEKALVNVTASSYTVPTRGYVFGQFSSFIRPGYLRATSATGTALKSTAYYDKTDGHSVVVVINDTSGDISEKVAGFNSTTTALTAYQTTTGNNPSVGLHHLSNVACTNGTGTTTQPVLFPAASVTTLIEQVGGTPAVPGAPGLFAATKMTLNGATVVKLSWQANGGSGAVGMADYMDIRYSNSGAISNNTLWGNATEINAKPPGIHSSDHQTYVVSALPNGTYYFAVKGHSKWGESSNPTYLTTAITIP